MREENSNLEKDNYKMKKTVNGLTKMLDSYDQ